MFKGQQFGTKGYQGVVKKSQYNDKGNFNVNRSRCNNCCELAHWAREFLTFEGISNQHKNVRPQLHSVQEELQKEYHDQDANKVAKMFDGKFEQQRPFIGMVKVLPCK